MLVEGPWNPRRDWVERLHDRDAGLASPRSRVCRSVPGVAIGLLGPVRAWRDNAPVTIGGAKPRRLLARLAAAAPDAVPTDALLEAVWGGQVPATARKVLQKYVLHLRDRLGRDAVVTAEAGYALRVEHLDSALFDRLLADACAARREGLEEQAWELLERAAALWHGNALQGLEDVPFAAAEGRRLDELRLVALEEQAEAGLATGRHEVLVAALEDLVDRHPLRERLWAALLLALYRSGRQADALAAYGSARAQLREELGIDPSPPGPAATPHPRPQPRPAAPACPAGQPAAGSQPVHRPRRGTAAGRGRPGQGARRDVARPRWRGQEQARARGRSLDGRALRGRGVAGGAGGHSGRRAHARGARAGPRSAAATRADTARRGRACPRGTGGAGPARWLRAPRRRRGAARRGPLLRLTGGGRAGDQSRASPGRW